MEKVNKLMGARGGELMYAVLARQNNNKRGSGGGDGGGGEGDRSKRPRQVRKKDKEQTGRVGQARDANEKRKLMEEEATMLRSDRSLLCVLGCTGDFTCVFS